MRKIDVLLLSALVLYDFGAQSLADSNFNTAPAETKIESKKILQYPELVLEADLFETTTVDYIDMSEIVIEFKKQQAITKEVSLLETNPEVIETVIMETPVVITMPDRFAEVADMTIETTPTQVVKIEKVEVTKKFAKDLFSLDSDNDGVLDIEDKCAGVAGVARFEGCPVPDSDGDGVNDEEDRCPFEAGSAENGGCPKEKDGAKNIDFLKNYPSIIFNITDIIKAA